MTKDEIVAETLRVYRNSFEGFIRFAIQQERQECALVCEEVMRRYKADTALDPNLNKVGEMSAELCALWIRKRGDK